MLVACLRFFVLRHKSKAERARISFPLRKQNQGLSRCFMARALLVSGVETPEDAGGRCFTRVFPFSLCLFCWIYSVLASPLAGQVREQGEGEAVGAADSGTQDTQGWGGCCLSLSSQNFLQPPRPPVQLWWAQEQPSLTAELVGVCLFASCFCGQKWPSLFLRESLPFVCPSLRHPNFILSSWFAHTG